MAEVGKTAINATTTANNIKSNPVIAGALAGIKSVGTANRNASNFTPAANVGIASLEGVGNPKAAEQLS